MGAKPSTHLNEEIEEEDCCSRYEENTYNAHMDCRTQFGMAPRPSFVSKCGETEDNYSPSIDAVQKCQPFARPEMRPVSTRAQRCYK